MSEEGSTAPGGSYGDLKSDTLADGISVDIIVPIHDALDHVQRCVESVLQHWQTPARLVLVNDGSGAECSTWLSRLAAHEPRVQLLELGENLGYTRAINVALRESTASFVVLLNSDTIVTLGWLEGMLRCASASDSIGIVGPLSNAASWQSLPHVTEGGQFATNPLPEGLSIEAVAELVRRCSRRAYPRTPVVNGFCFLIKRAVLDAVGLFDEACFPQGYGEENDYCVRAAHAGFELAIADDVFIYHAKSRSFGEERRALLSKAGGAALEQKHGAGTIARLSRGAKGVQALGTLRRLVATAYAEHRRRHLGVDPLSLRILFLLPVLSAGGGTHSVVQEVMAMRRLGVDAAIAVPPEAHTTFRHTYQDIQGVGAAFVSFTPDELLQLARRCDIVVATVYTSVALMERIRTAHPEVLCAYYVQDYEPLFFERGSERWHEARSSYTRIPDALLFAKTAWIARRVWEEHGVPVRKVAPSLDHDVYRPAPTVPATRLRIVAMVRPQTPRRGAARTMRVLRAIAKAHHERVVIDVFGCESRKAAFRELEQDFPFQNHGVLSRVQVAALLRTANVFVDFSDYQAFGRTGLEAMASGCAVVLPAAGGVEEYATDGDNAVLVDTDDEVECERRLDALIRDPGLLRRLRIRGLATAAGFTAHRAAVSELELFAEAAASHREANPPTLRKHVQLAPAVDKAQRPSWSSHARLLHGWGNATVQRAWTAEVAHASLPAPGSADVLILAHDSRLASPGDLAPWLVEWRRAGGKLLLDCASDTAVDTWLSSRERVHARLRWLAAAADAVVVPSQELREQLLGANPEVFIVPSYLDGVTWTVSSPRARARGATAPNSEGAVRIGFIGASGEWPLLQLIAGAAKQLERELGGAVSFEIAGEGRGKPPFGRRVGPPPRLGFCDYAAWMRQSLHWDVGILPVAPGACKEDPAHKLLQYAALGLATVASRTPLLSELVHDERTGLLVENNASAWFTALRRLIDDEPLRRSLADRARHDLVTRSTVEANSSVYVAVLEAVLKLPPRSDKLQPPQTWPSLQPQRIIDLKTLEVLGRKRRKLKLDPAAFFADSHSPVVRGLGKVFIRRR